MERNHGETSAGREQALGGRKRARKAAELIVEENPQRLKGARCRVDVAGPRTNDTCNTTNNTCAHTAEPGCCNLNTECNDNDACTSDVCDTVTHTCSHPAVAGCCNTDTDCADTDVCTSDVCDTTAHTCSRCASWAATRSSAAR